jgi:outer membrane protein OmpA-like peptidoglycan-associated protein
MSPAPGARRIALLVAVLTVVSTVLLPAGSRAADAGATCQRMFDWVVTYDVRFRESTAELSDSSRPTLDRLAEFARDCPAARIAITGHTDALGDETYNQVLSEQRAMAVADSLVQRGLERDRLMTAGAGSRRPVADNDAPRGRERNRRIEFKLLWPK